MPLETICIIGGGWSAAEVDLARLPGFVIGVNESALHAPCDAIVTMDRLFTEHRWKEVRIRIESATRLRSAYVRDAALKNIAERPDWLHPFTGAHKVSTFSEDPSRLHGSNSGACALNLAYQMRPQTVYLFGFDMGRSPSGRAYWWGEGYPWARPGGGTGNTRYAEWAAQFEEPAKAFQSAGISVINVSAASAIKCFDKIAPKQWRAVCAT